MIRAKAPPSVTKVRGTVTKAAPPSVTHRAKLADLAEMLERAMGRPRVHATDADRQRACWLRDKTAIKQLKDWTEITTPYLDRHNDYLQIYARKTDKGFILTDGGETLLDLEQSGCLMDSPKRQAILRTILNGFGIEHQATELQVTATSDNFALRKHNLIQAILSVHDMFFLASSTNRERLKAARG